MDFLFSQAEPLYTTLVLSFIYHGNSEINVTMVTSFIYVLGTFFHGYQLHISQQQVNKSIIR